MKLFPSCVSLNFSKETVRGNIAASPKAFLGEEPFQVISDFPSSHMWQGY